MSQHYNDIDVDVVDDIDDDWTRQRYLGQVYDAYDRARDAMFEADAARQPADDRRLVLAAVVDLIRTSQPILKHKPVWDEEIIERIPVQRPIENRTPSDTFDPATISTPGTSSTPDLREDTVAIEGLVGILRYQDGVETYEVELPQDQLAPSPELVKRTIPLSIPLLRYALMRATGALGEEGVLNAAGEEAEARDENPL